MENIKMKKLSIVNPIIIFDKINQDLVGKKVNIYHKTYGTKEGVITKVYKLPGINTKNISLNTFGYPIIIRKGDKFKINILGNISSKIAQDLIVEEKIFNFFKNNSEPKDSQIHEFAQSLNIDEHEFESIIYKNLGSFLGYGLSKEFIGEYDDKQIEMGIEIEMEHTNNPKIAKKIAMDHLSEISDYYTRLSKMEEEAKRGV
jgi:hypothetical protein